MRKVKLGLLALLAIGLLAVPLALGQDGNPPAGTKESAATSGQGTTEQTSKSGEQKVPTTIRKRIIDGKETIYVDGVEVVDKDELQTIKKAIGKMCEEYWEVRAILNKNTELKEFSGAVLRVCQVCRKITIPPGPIPPPPAD
jgi:hypothetical protein